jgi:hypothetical protein
MRRRRGDAKTDPVDLTVGRDLERHRLEHRARRLRLVIDALRERASASGDGSIPPALHRALADFSTELDHVRARLGERHAGRRA